MVVIINIEKLKHTINITHSITGPLPCHPQVSAQASPATVRSLSFPTVLLVSSLSLCAPVCGAHTNISKEILLCTLYTTGFSLVCAALFSFLSAA